MSAERSTPSVRLLVIVAKERDPRSVAHVLGAFNDDFMSDLPLEDFEEQVDKLKRTWTGEPEAYDFREMIVTVGFDLNSLFVDAVVEGQVEA